MQFLAIQSNPIAYLDTGGEGYPLVFIHGNSCTSKVFHKLIKALRGKFRIIALDMPGHGQSFPASNPSITYTIPGYAQILEEALTTLGVTKCAVLGYSLGGNISLQWACSSDKIEGIALLSTIPLHYSEKATECYPPYEGGYAGYPEKLNFDQATTYMKSVGFDVVDPEASFMVEDAMNTDPLSRSIMVASVLRGIGEDEHTLVEKLPIPLAVIAGKNDKALNIRLLQEIRYHILWKKKVFLLEHASHATPIHQSKEVSALLEEFFTDVRDLTKVK